MKLKSILLASAFAILGTTAAGCVGSGSASVTATTSSSADLVWVSPGVYVVENHPRAVFYSDGFYWRYDSGVWLRSRYYNTGFVRVRTSIVPTRVVRIERPRRYRHYHGPRKAKRRNARKHVRDRRESKLDHDRGHGNDWKHRR